jgi:hypothetical protein
MCPVTQIANLELVPKLRAFITHQVITDVQRHLFVSQPMPGEVEQSLMLNNPKWASSDQKIHSPDNHSLAASIKAASVLSSSVLLAAAAAWLMSTPGGSS